MLTGSAIPDHTVAAANPQTTQGSWCGPNGLKSSINLGTKNQANDTPIGVQTVATIFTPNSFALEINQAQITVRSIIGIIPASTELNMIIYVPLTFELRGWARFLPNPS